MLRILLRAAIAAILLLVAVQFYIDYRHTTYSINHGANAFDVFLWRLTAPGGHFAAWVLPDAYFSLCCDDPEILARREWLLPTLSWGFNALVWSAVASGATWVILRTRELRRVQSI